MVDERLEAIKESLIAMRDEPLRIKLLSDTATVPSRGSPGAVGYDLHADLAAYGPRGITLGVSERKLLPTSIAVALPEGTYGRIAPRSGNSVKLGLDVMAGVIDNDYRGEVKVLLVNLGHEPVNVTHGMRIAQLIVEVARNPPVVVTNDLENTQRGTGGFGSTGV